MKGLDKKDSTLIGFVCACLFNQVINKKDLNKWATGIVVNEKSYPLYIVELMDFNGALFEVINIIGFSPYWKRTEDEEKALYGIAYKRGMEIYDPSVGKQEALEKLIENPSIEKTFKKTFPFIIY